MKTRFIGYIVLLMVTMLFPNTAQVSMAQNSSKNVDRVIVLKGSTLKSKASGFAKLNYKPGKTPYQHFEIVAVGLKSETDYQLFVNGIAFDVKKSNTSGSIEFLFNSQSKDNTLDGAVKLPAELSSVLAIQNISIREKDLSVALIGDFNQDISTEASDNDPQVLSLLNSVSMQANQTETIVLPVTDPDGDALTVTVTCDRGNFITVSGLSLIMAPKDIDVGTHVCSAKVTDTFGLFTTIPFVITVTAANIAPTISPIPDQIIKTGEVKDIIVSASDADGNSGLRFVISQGPAFATIVDRGDGTAVLRLAPQQSDTQGGIVTVRVIDAGGLTAQTSFTLTLNKSVTISSVTRAKPNLFISGVGFGQAGATVTINNQNLSARVIGQSDSSITLKGSLKKLNLRAGANQITVSSGGTTSNTFILNMLDSEE